MQQIDDLHAAAGTVIDDIDAAAIAAVQQIVAGAAEQGVVTGAAIKAVGGQSTPQSVVARAAQHHFDIGQNIGADAGANGGAAGQADREARGLGAIVDSVSTDATVEAFVGRASGEGIITRAADHRIEVLQGAGIGAAEEAGGCAAVQGDGQIVDEP